MFEKIKQYLKPYIAQLRQFIEETIKWVTPKARQLQEELEQVSNHIHPETQSDAGLKRIAAFALDLFIAALMWLFPLGGPVLALAYLLIGDALPFLNGQSVGKQFFKLRVVVKGTLRPITRRYKRSFKRRITLLIPGLNLVDIFLYFTRGERTGDKWADTIVIEERYFTSPDKGSRT